MGGSCAQAEKPEIQEPGRPEGLPRTAAIARIVRRKKTPANRVWGRLVRLHLAGFSGPVAELAATGGRVAWWGVGSNQENRSVVFGVKPGQRALVADAIINFMDSP